MAAPRLAAGLMVGLALLLAGAFWRPAEAGERYLAPVQDRYEPGDIATMVGYLSAEEAPPEAAGLRAVETPAEVVPLGPLSVERPSVGPPLLRVSLTFEVPADAMPGAYEIVVEPGGAVAGSLSVGIDPPEPPLRTWSAGEPEIANLPPGAPVVPPTTRPIITPAPTAASIRVPVATTVPVQPAPPPEERANPALLVAGSAVVALCTGLVLVAMRD